MISPDQLERTLCDIVLPEHVEWIAPRNAQPPSSLRLTPGSTAEVAAIVRACARYRVPIHPIGSATRPSSLGPTKLRVFISTRRLDQVLLLDKTSLLAHVQAGITGNQLQAVLAPHGLSLGDYPPSVLASSVGGILAVRTPGKSSARHGFFEDAVVGLDAVLPDGKTIHTKIAPRRAAGPDLLRALCGSEGTLGFITSVVLRVHAQPEARFLAAFQLPSVGAAIASVYLALREEAAPAGLRIYDAAEARAHFPDSTFPDGSALLTVATAGLTDLAACDRDLIASAVAAEGGAPLDIAYAKTWWSRLQLREPTPQPSPTLDVMATPCKLRLVHEAATAALAAFAPTYQLRAHVSRFDADGAMLFFSLVHRQTVVATEALHAAAHQAVKPQLVDAIVQAGGWLPGARPRKLDGYLAALRAELDPHGVMNPGELTPEFFWQG